MKNPTLIFAGLGAATLALIAVASRRSPRGSGSEGSEESGESKAGDDWSSGPAYLTLPEDTSQLNRLAVAFQQAGVTNFIPEEFLTLRKWGVVAEMPEEYEDNIVKMAVQAQALRDRVGLPIAVMNGYRSPEYNQAVQGVPNSAHLRGAAADLELPSVHATADQDRELQVDAAKLWLTRTNDIAGLGVYTGGRVHLDVFHPGGLGRRSWGSGDVDGVINQAKAELGQS